MQQKTDSVLCPWCRTYYQLRNGTNCINCGGALPPPAGPHRGDAPPPVPRFIPKQFKNKLLYQKNYLLLFGALFAVANFPFSSRLNGLDIILIGIGAYCCWMGYARAMRKINVLQRGEIAEGAITSAGENLSTEVNGKHPYQIEYTYEVNGTKRKGQMNCWDETSLSHYEGEPVWVVYSTGSFENNSSIWPPLA
ncbi:MAG: hypothetical protein ACJ76F_06715 [Bacteroidia bacterium]